MKSIVWILGIVSGLSILSTLICGLWIRANEVTEISSLNFHMKSGIISVISMLAFVVAVLVFLAKSK